VEIVRLKLPPETLHNLEDNLALYFIGYARSASGILSDQHQRSLLKDREMLNNLHFTKKLGLDSRMALEAGDLRGFAGLMRIHWEHKKKRSQGMTNTVVDQYYQLGLDHGALGGKLVGAGGGGFLMFYTEDRTRLRRAMTEAGLREVRFRFDMEGTRAAG
jgi:D-glycero-alpha-D-manno-heptose-7-phosphate kinase